MDKKPSKARVKMIDKPKLRYKINGKQVSREEFEAVMRRREEAKADCEGYDAVEKPAGS